MPTSLTSSDSKRIAVLGGGISGLTAAYRLTKLMPGAQIELFEASDRLGGMLCTQRDGDYLIEMGADSFIDKLPAAVELCRELGLEDQIIPTNQEPRRALIAYGGKLHPVPTGFVQMRPEKYGPMLRTPLLSWRGKLRMLLERWQSNPPDLEKKNYDESLASFASRRLGREVFERLVQPLLAGIYTADPHKLSVAATMPTLIEAERQHGSLMNSVLAAHRKDVTEEKDTKASGARYASFVTLRDGLEQLINTLASKLPSESIHFDLAAEKVRRTSDKLWQIEFTNGKDQPPFHGVVTALPAHRTAKLVAETDAELSGLLASIPYASSAVVCSVYHRSQIDDPLDGFGIVVPSVEQSKIVAASFSSIKFPGRAPTDQVLIRTFVGGALQPELLELSDAEIVELAEQELSDMLKIEGKPLHVESVRWQQKMPQYHVGHLQLVDQIESLVAAHSGLELAGNAYRGVGIPQCVKSGEMAALRLAESLG